MLLHDQHRHRPHPGGDRVGLLDLVEAIAILFQHLPQSTHLPLDLAKPPKQRFALLRRAHENKTAVNETVLHTRRYTPT